MDLDGWRIIVDGDSFTAWGENLRLDAQLGDPIHVTYTVDGEPDGDWLNIRLLLQERWGEGWHVIDYIVLIDARDWSVDRDNRRHRIASRGGRVRLSARAGQMGLRVSERWG